jgi:hypothetical protein
MPQPENKPKLSDVARQTNAAKAARFSSTMIPAPPKPGPVTEPTNPDPASVVARPPAEETLREIIDKGETDFAEGKGTIISIDELQAKTGQKDSVPAVEPTPAPVKATRSRKGGILTIDEVINNEPPRGEPYPNQIRVAAKHHKLLRKLAFTHDVTINHIMYNLLDLLEQADQRDQQKGE